MSLQADYPISPSLAIAAKESLELSELVDSKELQRRLSQQALLPGLLPHGTRRVRLAGQLYDFILTRIKEPGNTMLYALSVQRPDFILPDAVAAARIAQAVLGARIQEINSSAAHIRTFIKVEPLQSDLPAS